MLKWECEARERPTAEHIREKEFPPDDFVSACRFILFYFIFKKVSCWKQLGSVNNVYVYNIISCPNFNSYYIYIYTVMLYYTYFKFEVCYSFMARRGMYEIHII